MRRRRLPVVAALAALAALAACGADGGAGTTVVTRARLPMDGGVAIGFEADGTPILGFTQSERPLLRLAGAEWAPHPMTSPLRVRAFGQDLDGAPVLLYGFGDMTATGALRLEGDHAVPLGDLVPGPFTGIFQGPSGSRFMTSNGPTQILRPGATRWELYLGDVFEVIRDADGQLYTTSPSAIVRLEADDTLRTVAACPASCTNLSGIDDRGRFYFGRFDTVTGFDPAAGAVDVVRPPPGLRFAGLRVTRRHSIILAATELSSPAPSNALSLFTLTEGDAGLALVAAHAQHPLDETARRFFEAPDGTLHVMQHDWLGVVVRSP